MNANLMGAPRPRNSADDREAFTGLTGKSFLDAKVRSGWRPGWMDHLLEPDRRRQMRTLPRERRLERNRFPFRPAPNDGEIFLRDPLFLHEQTETTRGCRIFGNEDEPAGFAIEPVDDGNLAAVGDLKRE